MSVDLSLANCLLSMREGSKCSVFITNVTPRSIFGTTISNFQPSASVGLELSDFPKSLLGSTQALSEAVRSENCCWCLMSVESAVVSFWLSY